MITTKWAVPKQLAITSSEVGHYFQPMTVSRLPWDVQWRYPFSKVKQIWKIITMCCTVCMDYFPSIYIYIHIVFIYAHRKRSFSLSIPCFLFISFNCHCPRDPSVASQVALPQGVSFDAEQQRYTVQTGDWHHTWMGGISMTT